MSDLFSCVPVFYLMNWEPQSVASCILISSKGNDIGIAGGTL